MTPAVAVFLLSVAFCIYTMAGYPLLLWIVARWHKVGIRKESLEIPVSVLLPVYNGERWIGPKLESILGLQYPTDLLEILVVDDGSTDGTARIVEQFAGRGNVKLLTLARGGKARALNAAMERATGEILFFTDVRQSLDRESLAHLVRCFADPKVGVVSGELVIGEGANVEETSVGLYWKYEKWIRKQLSRVDSVMGATGCIYAMRRELAERLPEDTLVDDMYLPIAAFFRGYRVIMEERALAYDYPTQLASEFRRKVRTLAGVYQVMGHYPALLGPKNRMWFHFVSHKVARLMMPWALIIAGWSTLLMPPPWVQWAALAQGAAYGLALSDYALPKKWPLKRLTSPVRTFVVLMTASLCAVCILLVPARVLWRETQVSHAAATK